MSWEGIPGKKYGRFSFFDIAIFTQGILLVALLSSEEWGNISSSIRIMNFYSAILAVFALVIVLYRVWVSLDFDLSNIDLLILGIFAVVLVSGVQSGFDYFTHRALLSWAITAASYCVFRMVHFKRVNTLFEILFCVALCRRGVYFLEKFLFNLEGRSTGLDVCTFLSACIGAYLVTNARTLWERLFYAVGSIVLVAGLDLMSGLTVFVIVLVLTLLMLQAHAGRVRPLTGIILAVLFVALVVSNLDYGFLTNSLFRLGMFWGNGAGFSMSLQDSFVSSNATEQPLTDSAYQVIFLDFGILGLCFFLVVCCAVFWSCVLRKDFGIAGVVLAICICLLNAPYSEALLMVLFAFMGMSCACSVDVGDFRIGKRPGSVFAKLIVTILAVFFVFHFVAYQTRDSQIQGYIMSGDKFYTAGLFTQALESYRKAALLVPKNPIPHMMLGKTFLEMDMYEEAVLLFERALKYGSRSREAYIGLAKAYWHLGKHSLALRILHEGAGLHSDITLEAPVEDEVEQNKGVAQVRLTEIEKVEYADGTISFEVVLENQGNGGVYLALAVSVLDFAEKEYFSASLGKIPIQAGRSYVLQESVNVALPKGVYVLKVFLRYGDRTDEAVGYFVVL